MIDHESKEWFTILVIKGTRTLWHVLCNEVGVGSKKQLFGGASEISFLFKSSDTAVKLDIQVPSNSSNDARTGRESSAWQMFAVFSCIKSKNKTW